MKLKKTISFILILILLTILFTGCTPDNIIKDLTEDNEEDLVNYEPIEGGQIVIPLTNLNTLNPLMTENLTYYYFSKLIYEGMFEIDNSLDTIPVLAENYSLINEGLSILIELKKGIKWHDGADFTANDVAFTINTLKYAKNMNSYTSFFQSIDTGFAPSNINTILDVKVIDDYKLEVSFDQISSNNIELLTFPIIPQHIFTDSRNSFAKALELENYQPVGTGPYKFVNYEKFKNISLVAYDGYREGKPFITNVEGKVLEDEQLILTAFETGQLSMAAAIGVDWDKYKSNKRIRTVEYVSNNYEFIGFNFDNEIFHNEKGLALRKAIYYGIDRQAIISKIFLGHASQVDVPVHPDSWLASEDANTYGYNLEKSKELLEAYGWKDRDEDGLLEDENGDKLTLRITTNSFNGLRLNTTEMIVEDLKKLGFEIIKDYEIKFVDNPPEAEIEAEWMSLNEKLNNNDFDMVVLGWEMSFIPDLSFMFLGTEALNVSNFIQYKNDKMNELLLNAFEAKSREEKKKAYIKLQQEIVDDIPYISLFYKNRALLVDSKIIGDLNPMFLNPYKGLKDCFIPESLQ